MKARQKMKACKARQKKKARKARQKMKARKARKKGTHVRSKDRKACRHVRHMSM